MSKDVRSILVFLGLILGCDQIRFASSPEGGGTSVQLGCIPNCAGRECGGDGCGGTCGACSAGFLCRDQAHCSLNPSSMWHITVRGAHLTQHDHDGTTWDPEGGMPDPRLCFTSVAQPNDRGCSTVQHDTFEPQWNLSTTNISATNLLRGIGFTITDVDDFFDDPVSNCVWSPTSDDLRRGETIVRCAGANIDLRLQSF